MKGKRTKIKILKAFYGDCILIQTYDIKGNDYTILIDGGPSKTFEKSLKAELRGIKKIDLVVLTHVDNDHINGLIKFLKSSLFKNIEIKNYWFNGGNLMKVKTSGEVGISEGIEFEKFLYKKELQEKWKDEILFTGKKECLASGIFYHILSPTIDTLTTLYDNWDDIDLNEGQGSGLVGTLTINDHPLLSSSLMELAQTPLKPDKPVKKDFANASSIAFALELFDCKLLLLGDARAEVINETLEIAFPQKEKNDFDFIKMSHHGSKNNFDMSIFNRVNCNNFIISTNGGIGRAKHPNRETIARIVCNKHRDKSQKVNIYFNYSRTELYKKIGKLIGDGEEQQENFTCHFDTQEILL